MNAEATEASARHEVCRLLRQRRIIGRFNRHVHKSGPGWDGFRALRRMNRADLRIAIFTLRCVAPKKARPVQEVFSLGMDCECPGLCHGHYPAKVPA